MPINPTRLMMEQQQQQQLGTEMTTKEVISCPKSHEEALSFIEEMTSKCDQVQKKVIGEIMRQNGETEYLKRYGVDKLTDRAGFKSRVPVVSYEDVQADIQRIANGDFSSILSGEPISEFLTSSGTSGGERKLMPTIKEETDRRQLLYSLLMPVMNKFVPDLDKGKALYFYFIKAETRTPGGLLARPVLTSYYKSSQFRNRPHDPYTVITSPNETILCNDSFQSMYAQMLCGLYNRHSVLRVGAVFASGLLRAIRFLLTHYSDLSRDISTGKPGTIITDPLVREAVSRVMMKPDPELARFVMEECVKGEEGIVKRIWPNTKYLDVIVTGAMAQYIPTLDYYSGGLPKASTMYASSECYFGLNLKPMCDPSEVTYTIMPNMAYFEFIPLPLHEDDDNHSLSSSSSLSDAAKPQGPQPNLVELADVEVGKQYELVITTYAGLYRYRVGDVLLVTSFHNSAPQFRFIRRKNVLLSIDSDKTDESELQQAVQRASQILQSESHASVAEYTSYADTKTIPGHYVIYWELIITTTHGDGKPTYPTQETLRKCCLEMEEGLNAVYRQCRVADGSLGPLEIRVVKEGTFEELMDYAISRGASINQYKVPRCVNFSPILELLDARVVSSHVSPNLPKWTPGGGQRRENISRD